IGWTCLARRLWGTGLNAEMKRLMLAHAFRFVERATFRVGHNNVISRAAMRNIGGRLTDRIDITQTPEGPIPHVIFEITREDFATGPLA
ncbi:MAG: GNAT family protein, partial [Croceibacterium sp.]